MGFTATLTEIFGMPTSLDPETQRAVDERNELAQLPVRTQDQERRLIELNDRMNRLGFMFEDREPLYHDFLQAWKDVKYSGRPPLTPDQVALRRKNDERIDWAARKTSGVSMIFVRRDAAGIPPKLVSAAARSPL